MTKEELLEKIDKEERWLIFEVERTSRDIGIAFSAIKKYVSDSVLEHSKSTEPCEDAISRQAAVRTAKEECEDGTFYDIPWKIADLPSVNPQEPSDISNDGTLTVNVEDGRKISRVLVCGANHWGGLYYPDEQKPKTGHWIDTADEINAKYGKHDYKCSKCGEYAERFIAGTEDWWSCVKPNYCPSCGAAMTESEEQA